MTTIGRSAAPAAWAGDFAVLGAMIVALVPLAGHPITARRFRVRERA